MDSYGPNIFQHSFSDLSRFPFLIAKQNPGVSIPPPPFAVHEEKEEVDDRRITFRAHSAKLSFVNLL